MRFGNVMGSRGSVIEIWQKQHNNNESLTVTHESMTRYLMTIPEACSLVVEAAEGEGGAIWVMKMGEKYNILELAKEITKKTGQEIKIIGMRPGETLTEEMMTLEERARAKETDKFFIIK